MLIKYTWADYLYYNIFYLRLPYIFDTTSVVHRSCCKCFVAVFLHDTLLESPYRVNEKKTEEYSSMLSLVYISGFVSLYLNEN